MAELNQLGFNLNQSTSRPKRVKAQIVPSNSEDGDGAEADHEVSGEESDEMSQELSGEDYLEDNSVKVTNILVICIWFLKIA